MKEKNNKFLTDTQSLLVQYLSKTPKKIETEDGIIKVPCINAIQELELLRLLSDENTLINEVVEIVYFDFKLSDVANLFDIIINHIIPTIATIYSDENFKALFPDVKKSTNPDKISELFGLTNIIFQSLTTFQQPLHEQYNLNVLIILLKLNHIKELHDIESQFNLLVNSGAYVATGDKKIYKDFTKWIRKALGTQQNTRQFLNTYDMYAYHYERLQKEKEKENKE